MIGHVRVSSWYHHHPKKHTHTNGQRHTHKHTRTKTHKDLKCIFISHEYTLALLSVGWYSCTEICNDQERTFYNTVLWLFEMIILNT